MKKEENKKQVSKPIVLIIKETEASVIEILNNSGLPNFILRPLLEKLYNQSIHLENQEYESAKSQYEKDFEKKEEK